MSETLGNIFDESGEALNILAKTFYPDNGDDFIRRESTRLGDPDLIRKGERDRVSEIVILKDETGIVVAVGLNHYYSWGLISPQLYFKPLYSEDNLTGLKIVNFAEMVSGLVKPEITPAIVSEIAFFTVLPEFRRLGYGTNIFELMRSKMGQSLEQGDLFYTVVDAYTDQVTCGHKVFRHLKENSDRHLLGSVVDVLCIENELNVPGSAFSPRGEHRATEKFAISSGMVFVGYTKGFGRVWAQRQNEATT